MKYILIFLNKNTNLITYKGILFSNTIFKLLKNLNIILLKLGFIKNNYFSNN